MYPDKITSINNLAGNLGPTLSFLHMLDYSDTAFVARCDQDDILKEIHEETKFARLENPTIDTR